jgi:hypothetical protein
MSPQSYSRFPACPCSSPPISAPLGKSSTRCYWTTFDLGTRIRAHASNVRSCPHKSDWCWEDPKDKKHYKLRTPRLERLFDYVDEGGILDGHGDILGDIRGDLVLESQAGRKSKNFDVSTRAHPYPPQLSMFYRHKTAVRP